MDFPTARLEPEGKPVFIDVEREYIHLIRAETIPDEIQQTLSKFFFSHRIPRKLLEGIRHENEVKLSLSENTLIEIDQLNVKIEEKGNCVSLRFPQVIYLSTFLNALCLEYSFVSTGGNKFEMVPIRHIERAQQFRPKSRKSLEKCVRDLYAHQSLLEFLGYPLSDGDKLEDLKIVEDDILLELVQTPTNKMLFRHFTCSKVDPTYSLLVMLILVSNFPSEEETKSIIVDHKESIEAGEKVYYIDDLHFAESANISEDYSSLKVQWSTITVRQFQHMGNINIAMKLLENSILATFATGHPLIKVLFNVMASLFVMRDEYETYHAELFNILVGISEMFHPSEKICQSDLEQIEHIMFWLFVSIIEQCNIVKLLELKETEQVLEPCWMIVRTFHPLLDNLICKAGRRSFSFLGKLVLSLFSNTLSGPKLWALWIAAFASGNPIEFSQILIAAILIIIYPEIIDRENKVDAIEKEVRVVLLNSSVDFLINITLKLKKAITIEKE